MFCKNCGNKIEEESKFCGKCGKEVEADTTSPNNTRPSIAVKKNNNSSHWLLWWKIEDDELKNQIDNYSILGITRSARGQSVMCLIFSAIITVLLIQLSTWPTNAYLDVALFVVLAFFIYHGHRWAMAGAMILWTFEKIYSIYQATTSGSDAGVTIFISILWWATYMHAFWLAYKVETERNKIML